MALFRPRSFIQEKLVSPAQKCAFTAVQREHGSLVSRQTPVSPENATEMTQHNTICKWLTQARIKEGAPIRLRRTTHHAAPGHAPRARFGAPTPASDNFFFFPDFYVCTTSPVCLSTGVRWQNYARSCVRAAGAAGWARNRPRGPARGRAVGRLLSRTVALQPAIMSSDLLIVST